jgi:hypothetical protein
MIDQMSFKGMIGPLEDRHRYCLDRVTYENIYAEKSKQATTFVDSPLTNAQIHLKPFIRKTSTDLILGLEVWLPLAASTVGQNFLHTGPDTVKDELRVASQLIRAVLLERGFTRQEINSCLETAELINMELTWHNSTSSRSAARKLFRSTHQHLKGQEAIRSRHDINVACVDYRETYGNGSFLATLKSEDQFRQYLKAEQASSARKSDREACFLAKPLAPYRKRLLGEVDSHVRNEVILSRTTLARHGLSHPSSWTGDAAYMLVGDVMQACRLRATPLLDTEQTALTRLSTGAEADYERYITGEDVLSGLPAQLATRRRQQLLAVGVDIALSYKKHGRAVNDSLARRLDFEGRCKPPDDLRRLCLCDVSAGPLMEELNALVEFLTDGVVPESLQGQAPACWSSKWMARAMRREAIRSKAASHEST